MIRNARCEMAMGPVNEIFGDITALLIPSLIFIEITVVGRLFLPEIILFCLLLFLLISRGRMLFAPMPKRCILLGLIWLFSQIITDVVRETPFDDFARGWSKIVFLLLNFSSLYLLIYRNEKRLLLFAVGIVIGKILDYYISPDSYALSYPWKFGVGSAITLILVLCSQLPLVSRISLGPAVLNACVGLLNIYFGFRSLGAICMLTATFLLYHRLHRRFIAQEIDWKKIAGTLLLMLVTAVIMNEVYGLVAMKGWLGYDTQQKYYVQSRGKFGLLVGARSEFLASSRAIMDSPIIGHGSWAKDPEYFYILNEQLKRLDYHTSLALRSELIPSHSYIFGAWVESGFLGAVFWFWIFVLAIKTVIYIFKMDIYFLPLILFVCFHLFWDILFSPFGSVARLYVAYYMVLLMSIQATYSSIDIYGNGKK